MKNDERIERMKSIAEAIAESNPADRVPVTFESCHHIEGPFFHGTKTAFEVSDRLAPGHLSNYHEGRTSNHVYFAALLEPAVWAAELATALAGSEEPGRIYFVEPTGPFEDDPNVTNKRFPGNLTRSFRTRHPMRIIDEVQTWEGHAPQDLQERIDNIIRLRQQGLDVIEDQPKRPRTVTRFTHDDVFTGRGSLASKSLVGRFDPFRGARGDAMAWRPTAESGSWMSLRTRGSSLRRAARAFGRRPRRQDPRPASRASRILNR